VTMKLYRRRPDGALEPAPVEGLDHRRRLRSRRWRAAPLENPEAREADPRIAAAGIVALSALTFAALVVGYTIGLWG
jgi:hypothetical protein